MCLSVAVSRPNDVLAKGFHAGHEWNIVHNRMGFRCGYVKVEAGHPWHGKDYNDIDADVHGGLTFAEHDVSCDKGGDDTGYWVGFDCAHCMDAPDPSLLRNGIRNPSRVMSDIFYGLTSDRPVVRDQEYVESECRSLCDQAAKAA